VRAARRVRIGGHEIRTYHGWHEASATADEARSPASGPPRSLFVSRPDAAALLGVSVDTLDRRIAAGAIHVFRIGRRVQILRSVLLAYIQAQ
jgi:excisionase family DNA binding protein